MPDVILSSFFFKTITDVARYLSTDIIENPFDLAVKRSNVLSDAPRKMNRAAFDPRRHLNVS